MTCRVARNIATQAIKSDRLAAHDGLYVGLMSGTSADGVDAALVDISDAQIRYIHGTFLPYSSVVRQQVLDFNKQNDISSIRLLELEQQITSLCAQSVLHLLDETGIDGTRITAVGCHGQTVAHQPDAPLPYTVQLLDPSRLAHLCGIDTVADFRRADMAAGGCGAPLVPAFHSAVLASSQLTIVLNLGGISNISILHPDGNVSGYDTGPANTLLDAWIGENLAQPFDNNGQWASTGSISEPLLKRMLADEYFQQQPPKSTGPDYFNLVWLKQIATESEKPEDVQATLVELTARSIATAILTSAPGVDRVLACGGGASNAFLMGRIAKALHPVPLGKTSDEGIDCDYCEAMAFAWLAYKFLRREPGNLPAVTGASQPIVLGGLYPTTPKTLYL